MGVLNSLFHVALHLPSLPFPLIRGAAAHRCQPRPRPTPCCQRQFSSLLLTDLMNEIPLDIDTNVLPDDRILVRNTIACLCTLRHQRMFHTMNVKRVTGGCNLIAKMSDGENFDFNNTDLEILASVSPLRITSTAFERRRGSMQIRVRIISSDQPVNITDAMITHVRKRQRMSNLP